MSKDEWVNAAEALLKRRLRDNSRSYAESLYQTFVIDDGDEWTPEAAVREDMNYWDA